MVPGLRCHSQEPATEAQSGTRDRVRMRHRWHGARGRMEARWCAGREGKILSACGDYSLCNMEDGISMLAERGAGYEGATGEPINWRRMRPGWGFPKRRPGEDGGGRRRGRGRKTGRSQMGCTGMTGRRAAGRDVQGSRLGRLVLVLGQYGEAGSAGRGLVGWERDARYHLWIGTDKTNRRAVVGQFRRRQVVCV